MLPRLFVALILSLSFIASPGSAMAQDGAAYGRGMDHYLQGRHTQAAAIWRMAAVAGDARAAIGLGVMAENGIGGPRNTSEALRWFEYASALGSPDAAAALDRLYALPDDALSSDAPPVNIDLSILDELYDPVNQEPASRMNSGPIPLLR